MSIKPNLNRIISLLLCFLILFTSIDLSSLIVNAKDVEVTIETNPIVDIVVTQKDNNLDMSNFKEDLFEVLELYGINTKNINVDTVERNVVSTNDADASTIFNEWGRIGYPGNWSLTTYDNYNVIYNSENTPGVTSFYYDDSFDYTNISIEYDMRTADADDDLVGVFLRFNISEDNTSTYSKKATTYMYLETKDGSTQWNFHNGLYKIQNNQVMVESCGSYNTDGYKSTLFGYPCWHDNGASIKLNIYGGPLATVSSGWPSKNTWTHYKYSINGNNIKVYRNNTLVLDYTDNSSSVIKTGSFGLVNFSQAVMFKDVKIETSTTKAFKDVLLAPAWREEAHHIVVNVDDLEDETIIGNDYKGEVLSRTMNDSIHLIQWGTDTNKTNIENFIKSNDNNGTFTYNNDYEQAIIDTAVYIKNLIGQSSDTEYVLINQDVELNVNPSTLKNGAISNDYPAGRWFINHDYTYYSNNLGQSSQTNVFTPNLLCNFDKPGKYEILFDNQLVKEVYAHRAPVASFRVTRSGTSLTLTNTSYDLDSTKDIGYGKGIASATWYYKLATSTSWTKGKLTTFDSSKTFLVKLVVTDFQGAKSTYAVKYIGTGLPVASFNYQSGTIAKNSELEIIDNSYDPTGLDITSYKWELKKGVTVIGTYSGLDGYKKDFSDLGAGTYSYTLVVTNSNGEQSEAFTRSFKVLETYQQIVYVRYQNIDGSWTYYTKSFDKEYVDGQTFNWYYGGNNVYKTTGLSYIVTAAKTSYVDVYRQTYTQNVYTRYQNADGTWGDYSLVKSETLRCGEGFSWSFAETERYKGENLSYTVNCAKDNYIDIYRQEYQQKVYARFKTNDGTWGDYTLVYNDKALYESNFSWTYDETNEFKYTNVSYTVNKDITTYVDVDRKTYSQKIYIRYEEPNGDYTDYDLILDENLHYGSTLSYVKNSTNVFKECNYSYIVTEPKIHYITIDRQEVDITLTGDDNINELIGSGTYNYGQTITINAIPKTGYHFVYWDGETTNYTIQEYTFNIMEDMSFKAYSEINSSTLEINPNGGSYNNVSGTTSITKNYNTIINISNPVKEGYTFVKWELGGDKNGTLNGSTYKFGIEHGKTDVLTAIYNKNSYTQTIQIRYENIDGTLSDYETVYTEDVPYGDSFTWSQEATEAFPSTSVEYIVRGAETKQITLYRNEFYVSLTKGNGINAVSGSGRYNYGATVTISADVMSGYTWSKWTGDGISTSKTFTITVTDDVSYTASAYQNKSKVIINPNGGIWNNNSNNQTFESTSGDVLNLPNPTRDGYAFVGWEQTNNYGTVQKSGSQYIYVYGSENEVTETLTAVWTETECRQIVKIRFENEDGTYTDYQEAINKVYSVGETLTYYRAEDDLYQEAYISYKVTEPKTYELTIYRQKYNVSIEVGEGIISVEGEGDYNKNQEVTLKASVLKGYTFGGWISDEDFSEDLIYNFYITSNKSFSAWATINSSYLYINANGGMLEDGSDWMEYYENYNTTIEIANPTLDGYVFGGWEISGSNGSLQQIDEDYYSYTFGPIHEEEDYLSAIWIEDDFVVKYIDVVETENGKQLGLVIESANYLDEVSGSDMGNDTSENAYYEGYSYVGCTEAIVENEITTVYRFFSAVDAKINGSILWEDWNNKNSSRPDTITLQITSSNGEKDEYTLSSSLTEFSYEYEKYDEVGNEITYDLSVIVESQNKMISYDVNITGYNIVLLAESKLIDINVNLKWADKDNYYNSRPNAVNVSLLQNGNVLEIKENKTISFTKKPYYDANGDKYEYTLSQKSITGYETTIDNKNYTITNTYIEPYYTISIPKNIEIGDDKKATYSITVSGYVYSHQNIYVVPQDSVSEENGINFYMRENEGFKAPVLATVSQYTTKWPSTDINNGTTRNGTIEAQDLTPGSWSGSLNFIITFE